MEKKLKVLVSCYACSPYKGSEPGMGWNFIKGLSEFHELHIIVEQKKWEVEINKYLKENPNFKKNVTFYFIKKERNKKLRKIWPPSYYWFYKIWQKKAFELAFELDDLENFDIIHQLNMVGFREPGYLWKLKKPFVWGPIGGMENTNWKLLLNLSFKEFVFYGLRNIFNTYQKSFLVRPKLAARNLTSKLISATEKNKKDIKKYWGVDSIIIPEVGMNDFNVQVVNIREEGEPLKIVWSGQHTGGKALNILLKSLVKLPEDTLWKLDILGEGQMTTKWKKLANGLGVQNNCNWYGWMDREKSIEIMKKAHVLCITSIKDLTSTVTLEALSLGLPIIAIDHCGFSNVINSNCGIKIPISKPSKLQMLFSESINMLYLKENYRQKLCKGALDRSKDFSWKKKVNKLNEIYYSLLNIDDNEK